MVASRPELRRAWSTVTRVGLVALLLLPHLAFYWWTWKTWGPLLVFLGANVALVWLARRERADRLDLRPQSAIAN